MRVDLRLIGIIFSMAVIISLAFDFKKKIENFNDIHLDISKNLFELKQNIYEHTSITNTAIINLAFNNDTFVENYKKFKRLEVSFNTNKKHKKFYPRIYQKLDKLFKQQNEIFNMTEKFLVRNAKVKNSLAILYKRLNINYQDRYKENFVKFLTNSLYQQTNILRHTKLEDDLYEYFKGTKDKNIDYKLNFIHIDILYTQIPKLKTLINEVQNNSAKNMLDDIFLTLDKEASHQKRSMKSKLFMIIAGAILSFIVILLLARDIKIQLERLREKDKLILKQSKHAAMGEMIDAIAHQWKQPINIIKMRVDFLTIMKEKNEEIKREDIDEFQEKVNTQLDHMTNTLDEFRNFLRPNKATKLFSVEKCVNSVLLLLKDELLKNTIDSKVQVLKDFKIDGIENEFKHVLINLINNAKDAFIENKIENKKITITIDTTKIYIQDNAGGIPENIIGKVFEANFTTKEEDKGTGIGLYMTKEILDKINSDIEVKNENNGACFIITSHKKINDS